MMLPVFLGSVDQSILASALPTIGRDLGDVHHLPWLITAFLIASTALTPFYGKFADIHGRRAAMLIGVTVYMTGSLVCAASQNMLTLIFGRIVQGCGAGGLTVTANMVLGDIAPAKERGKYYTYFSLAFMTAGGSGPALGGWISEHLHWQMIFLWNLPLCALAIAIALTVLRRLPRRERPHRLDVAGALLVMAASSTFMLALNLGGVRYPWRRRRFWLCSPPPSCRARGLSCGFARRESHSSRSRSWPTLPRGSRSRSIRSVGARLSR
jgi:MFS family permease